MNTLLLLLLVVGVQGLLYGLIYPKAVQRNLQRLVWLDSLFALLLFVVVGVKYWGTGHQFDFGLFSTNWLLATLLLYVPVSCVFLMGYCRRFNMGLRDLGEAFSPEDDARFFVLNADSDVALAERISQRLQGGQQQTRRQLEQFGGAAQERLQARFAQAAVPFPAGAVSLLYFQDREQMELYAADSDELWYKVAEYPSLVSLGVGGLLPKVIDDVPFGIFTGGLLNDAPSSRFAGSSSLFDEEGEVDIAGYATHGSGFMLFHALSDVGYIISSEEAAEELFFLAARVEGGIRVVSSPSDFRRNRLAASDDDSLHAELEIELEKYPV